MRKFTLSNETLNKLDHLLEGLGHLEKSKAIDVLLLKSIDLYLTYKKEGKFHACPYDQGTFIPPYLVR